MYRTFFKAFTVLTAIVMAGFFVSCQEEETIADVDHFVLTSTQEIEERCAAGAAGCYELVFPVTLQFADSTTATVNDYLEMRQAIRDWYVANGGRPRPWNRPTLAFPIQVMNEAGEIITVETPQELRELVAECDPRPGGPGHHGGHGPCFTLNFPLTVMFPDSSTVTVASQQELRVATHTWNQNNPGQPARPQFVFPLEVTLKDGTVVVVNSREELRALKEDCRG